MADERFTTRHEETFSLPPHEDVVPRTIYQRLLPVPPLAFETVDVLAVFADGRWSVEPPEFAPSLVAGFYQIAGKPTHVVGTVIAARGVHTLAEMRALAEDRQP